MQLGIRLHDVKEASLEERLQIVKEQGFTCGHLAITKVMDGWKMDGGMLTPGFAHYLKRQFAKADLDVAVLGCYLNLGTPNQVSLHSTQKTYMAHIRFASLLGAGVVGTETGAVNEQYVYEPGNHTKEGLQCFIENIKPVIEYAEKMGVIVAIEPVYHHIVWNAQCARTVLDAIDSPNLQIIFDPVNLLDISNYENRDEIFREAMELLADDIAVVHLKDFVVEDGKLKSVAAGTGEMHYEEIIRFLKERKPFIQATLEDTTPQNAEAARKYIEDIWEHC